MRFLLTYDGALPSNGGRKDKDRIRRQLHPQLKQLWRVDQALSAIKEPLHVPVEGFDFVPIVTKDLHLACQLEVTILQPGPPGPLIKQQGDIDNRLKTLFDSLAVPPADQVKGIDPPTADEVPFYCLLEDDGRICVFRRNGPVVPGVMAHPRSEAA